MKKFLLTILMLSISATIIHGQVLLTIIFGDKLNSPTTEFGLNAGAAISSLTGITGTSHTSNLAIGTFFTWKFHDRFHLQPELYFAFKGGAEEMPPFFIEDPDITLPIEEMNVVRTTNYFSLPVLLKVRTVNQFRIILGPQISLATSNSDKMFYTVDKEREIVASKISREAVARMDAGFSAGIGYKLGKGQGVSIEVKYYMGLIDTMPEKEFDSKNRIFLLQAGIPIKGFSSEDK